MSSKASKSEVSNFISEIDFFRHLHKSKYLNIVVLTWQISIHFIKMNFLNVQNMTNVAHNCDSPFKKHRSKKALFQGWVLMWRHFCAIRVSVLCTKNNLVEANLFSGGLVVGSLDSNYSEKRKTKPFLTTSSSGCTYHRTKSVILDFSTFFLGKIWRFFVDERQCLNFLSWESRNWTAT